MPKRNIPAYAIVELLMRLSQFNKSIGDYRGHTLRVENIIVKTTGGSITFSKKLVMHQFNDPELIADHELANLAMLFRPARLVSKTI